MKYIILECCIDNYYKLARKKNFMKKLLVSVVLVLGLLALESEHANAEKCEFQKLKV